MNEHQNELEKLQKAALLIEEMSMGRLKVCPSTVGHVYIRPESDAYIGLQMQITPESTPGRYKDICFSCTKEARMEFDSAVLDAYQQALVQAQAQSQRGLEAPDPTQGPAYDASPAVNM